MEYIYICKNGIYIYIYHCYLDLPNIYRSISYMILYIADACMNVMNDNVMISVIIADKSFFICDRNK